MNSFIPSIQELRELLHLVGSTQEKAKMGF